MKKGNDLIKIIRWGMMLFFLSFALTDIHCNVLGEEISQEQITTPETETVQETEETEKPQDQESPLEKLHCALVSNRGMAQDSPENSMPALKKAIELGYSDIKVDLRRCHPDSEGQAVWVAADSDFLIGTMGVNKKISNLTYEQLLQYSYLQDNNGSYSDDEMRIVSLNDIIDLMKQCKEEGKNIRWQFEIKIATDSDYDSYLYEIINALKESEVQDVAEFSSYDFTYIKKINEIDSSFVTWFCSTKIDETTMSYASMSNADGICFKGNSENNTDEVVAEAQSRGYRLSVYNIEGPILMGAYYNMGIRHFVTKAISPITLKAEDVTKKYNLDEIQCSLSKEVYDYSGDETLPELIVEYRGEELQEKINYALSYENIVAPGEATVVVTGLNNCEGERRITYQIKLRTVTDLKITSLQATYAKLSWKKEPRATGYMIYCYDRIEKKYSLVKTIKDGETVTAKVKKLTSGVKQKFKVKAYMILGEETYESDYSQIVRGYTKPQKTKLGVITRYHNYDRLRVKWVKQTNCSGYDVCIATNKKMTKNVKHFNVSGKSKKKYKVKKLINTKTYYVKVRAYVKDGKTKKYGAYSDAYKSAGKK